MDSIVFKTKLSKRTSLNAGGMVLLSFAVSFAVLFISYILLRSSVLPISINSILDDLNHSVHHWHVLVVGLLPIYVALMVFGAAMVGIYFGTFLHHWIMRFFKKSQ